ncbi:MAG: hypothetical protein V1818_03725 [Candidatus Aenigmatarchaeota archaeon]
MNPEKEYEEPPEVEETYLSIGEDDDPETILYKLFSEFDPGFLNEKSGNTALYNPFILYLKGKTYSPIDANALIGNIVDGINEFNDLHTSAQFGFNPSIVTCNIHSSSSINYDSGCWSNTLSTSSYCNIYVHSNTNIFSERIKIRVLLTNLGPVMGKSILKITITMCDG